MDTRSAEHKVFCSTYDGSSTSIPFINLLSVSYKKYLFGKHKDRVPFIPPTFFYECDNLQFYTIHEIIFL